MRHKSNSKTRPLFTLSLEMTRLVNETRLLLVPCFNSDIYSIYYCTTGRAIRGNIQFEAGSIVPRCARANTASLKLNIPPYCPTQRSAVIDLLYDLHTVLLVVHACSRF